MSLTVPTITNCNLTMDVNPSVVGNLLETLNVSLPVFFNGITELVTLTGSFTPVNNTQSLVSSLPSNQAPNFVILVTDGQVNLTIKSGPTTLLDQNPVLKLYFNTMLANSTYNISDILLDGTTSALVPMLQGQAVNFTLLYGKATIA